MRKTSHFLIREAASHELGIVAELRGAMASEMGYDWSAYLGWQERLTEYFEETQQSGVRQFFIACADGDVVAMFALSILEDELRPALGMLRGYADALYVKPAWRRLGIARSLVQHGIDWLRGRGCVIIRGRPGRATWTLFESLGFLPGGEVELDLKEAPSTDT